MDKTQRAKVRKMDVPFFFKKAIALSEAEAIDYPNFKSMAHDGTERDAACMGAWAATRRGQAKGVAVLWRQRGRPAQPSGGGA